MRTPSLILSLMLSACFSVDDSRVVIRCDADHICPSGLVCRADQICGPGDSAADLGTADAATDLPTSMSGCAMGGGEQLGLVWACPFSQLMSMQASKLCKSGKLCKSATDLQGSARCKQLDGFYAAETFSAYNAGPGNVGSTVCGATLGYPVYFGCGRVNIGIVYQMGFPCYGFERLIDCQASGSGWNCQSTLDQTSTTVPGGVLCCP